MRILNTLAATLHAAANEQDCFLCGMTAQRPVCDGCTAACPALPATLCPRCALPSATGETCGRCLQTAPHFDATVAAFAYGAPLDQALQAFKYRAALGLAGFLSGALAAAIRTRTAALPIGAQAELIVPMPLFRGRLAERGFNQALELARPLAKLRGAALETGAVRRIRDTPPQARLPWAERVSNIQDAFACAQPANVAGWRVAVVDDVMTTGATLNELARVLKSAGAAHVSNWIVARALPPGWANHEGETEG